MAETATQAALASWSFPFWATSGLCASALLYLRGFRKIRLTRPHLFPSWRAWCFLGGLLSLYIAIGSPIDALDDVLLIRPYDTAPDLYVSSAPAALVGRAGSSILAFAAAMAASRRSWPAFPHAVATPAIPPAHPPRLRMAGNEHRLPRLACPRGLRTGAELGCLARAGARLLSHHRTALLVSPGSALAKRQPRLSLALLPYLVAADLVNTAFSASLTFAGKVIYPELRHRPQSL